MKAILLSLLALAAALPQAIAQEADLTRATVDVGEGRLESLLTDAQKQAVKHLAITGTPTEEDYAYLRSGLLAQLEELDLRDTYVDTIPARAFMFHNEGDYHGIKITLPLSLRHVCEHGLFLSGIYAAFVVTGDFPTFGEEAFNRHDTNTKFALSAENRKLKTDESDAIYSSDGRTMFFYDEIDFAKPDVEIKYGVETIGGYAFSGISLNWDSDILLPETVDSVGDRAFADITAWRGFQQETVFGGYKYIEGPSVVCEAIRPPKLGRDVFACEDGEDGFISGLGAILYVPDESIELYRNSGWDAFGTIKGISSIIGGMVKVDAGRGLLADQLTEIQRGAVTHLTVTGRLADEDYAYICAELLGQLEEIDLRHSSIDTIPENAFNKETGSKDLTVILPECTRHICSNALALRGRGVSYQLTGDFPSLDANAIRLSWAASLAPSFDNAYCIEDESGNILSAGGLTLHWWGGLGLDIKIPDGTKVVGGGVFERQIFDERVQFQIPESVDSVGDRAFADVGIAFLASAPYGHGAEPSMTCNAAVPPKLGRDVFAFDGDEVPSYIKAATLYVPDESLELYKNSGWNAFGAIKGLYGHLQAIDATGEEGGKVSLSYSSGMLTLKSGRAISRVAVYSADGKQLSVKRASGNRIDMMLPKVAATLCLIKIDYKDGTSETIKIAL